MTFTVIGPGIRNTIPATNLLRPQGLQETHKTEPKKAIDDQDPDQSNQPKPTSATQAYQETDELFSHKLGITAEEIMSYPVVALTSNHTIENALEKLENHAFRHIPIIEAATQQLTGIISERDLLLYLAEAHTSSEEAVATLATKLDSFINKRVFTASADTRVDELARLLVAQRIGVMPIVEESTQVIGIITRSDILRTLVEHNSLELWA